MTRFVKYIYKEKYTKNIFHSHLFSYFFFYFLVKIRGYRVDSFITIEKPYPERSVFIFIYVNREP